MCESFHYFHSLLDIVYLFLELLESSHSIVFPKGLLYAAHRRCFDSYLYHMQHSLLVSQVGEFARE